MSERIEKIKKHVKDHRSVYIASGIGLGVGIIGTLIVTNKTDIKQTIDSFKFQWKSPTTNNVTTVLVRRGHPGNIIRCKETGEVFASQNRAAKQMGLNPSYLCAHLKGKFDHVGGYTFEKIKEAE